MMLEAIRHPVERTDLTSHHFGPKLTAAEKVAQDTGDSQTQVKRYIRLTNLIPEIRDMVDEKKLGMTPAVELSYLKPEEQKSFLGAMDYAQAVPSLSQAQRIRKLSQNGDCELDTMCGIMNETKKEDLGQISFKASELQQFFPKSYTPKQMSDTILRLLEQWQRRRQREQQR